MDNAEAVSIGRALEAFDELVGVRAHLKADRVKRE